MQPCASSSLFCIIWRFKKKQIMAYYFSYGWLLRPFGAKGIAQAQVVAVKGLLVYFNLISQHAGSSSFYSFKFPTTCVVFDFLSLTYDTHTYMLTHLDKAPNVKGFLQHKTELNANNRGRNFCLNNLPSPTPKWISGVMMESIDSSEMLVKCCQWMASSIVSAIWCFFFIGGKLTCRQNGLFFQ